MPAPASYSKWDKLDVSDDKDDIRAKKAAEVKEDMTPKGQSRMTRIKPEPGFVVKTCLKGGTQVVMLNVVQHADLAPATSTFEDGREAWWRRKDKAGADVHVYDACFSPNVLERAKVCDSWKIMVACTVHAGVQTMHKIELGLDWKLPKLAYFGNFGHGPSVMSHIRTLHGIHAADAANEQAIEWPPPKPVTATERPVNVPKPAPGADPTLKPAPTPKELKRWLDLLEISYAGVLERAELVALLQNAI
ncbi:hypothetical protein T492DRAFT_834490 [Pavlovales sp. CCMP2436]|nr:hypothetical protein T492DRAFT_834490 [Pavlovales sp. CCMP2436]